jgi:hypothetical protein
MCEGLRGVDLGGGVQDSKMARGGVRPALGKRDS